MRPTTVYFENDNSTRFGQHMCNQYLLRAPHKVTGMSRNAAAGEKYVTIHNMQYRDDYHIQGVYSWGGVHC